MGWNGSGTFNRIYSWVADAAAGLDISASRMDTDTDDIAANGFGNCITRDGQGQPTANLPMAGFRHTGVQNGVARSDYAAMGQAQDGLLEWTIFGGSSDAITATYTPEHPSLTDGQLFCGRATAANATTTPTFNPDSLGANTITRAGGSALQIGDIPGNLAEVIFRYNAANTRFELLNPANALNSGIAQTGAVMLTVASTAPSGWLMFDDTTMGSASSGANHASAANQALFTLFFNNISDTNAPLLTSTGGATTRSAQGTAAAAWAANCRMTLPLTLGRALGVAGAGSGLTSRALGAPVGAETVTLAANQIPTLTASNSSQSISVNNTGGTGVAATTTTSNVIGIGAVNSGSNVVPASTAASWTGSLTLTTANSISATYTNGSQQTVSNMQPSSFLNAIIKL